MITIIIEYNQSSSPSPTKVNKILASVPQREYNNICRNKPTNKAVLHKHIGDIMKQNLTQEEYDRINQLVECALTSPNKQEAQKYISELQSFGYSLHGNAGNILDKCSLM